MTDGITPAQPLRLHSQTQTDDRGNFHYQGDLHRPIETFADLSCRIERHLAMTFADSRFSLRRETFAGACKIIAELIHHPAELAGEADRDALKTSVRDQIERFGFTCSNFYQDYLSCAFYSEVRIGERYWAALAARRGTAHPVEQ